MTGGEVAGAGVVGDEGPSQETVGCQLVSYEWEMNGAWGWCLPCDEVTHRPPDTQHSEEVARGEGQELEEKRTVDGEIPADTEADARVQCAYTGEVLLVCRELYSGRGYATYPTQVGPPPAARPNTPVINRVRLKAGRRPITSEAMPQKEAPRQRPKNKAQVVKRTVLSEMPNSMESWVSVKATPYGALAGERMAIFRSCLLLSYLKPETMNIILSACVGWACPRACYLLIGKPSKSTQHKQLPLIPAHANILNCSVDKLRFTCRKNNQI